MNRRTESEAFLRLARKAKQAIRGSSMQPDAVQTENEPLSFNGELRAECLNQSWLLSLVAARDKIEAWRQDYDHARLHSASDNLTPQTFARRGIPPASATPRPAEYDEPRGAKNVSSWLDQKRRAGQGDVMDIHVIRLQGVGR